MNADTIAWTVTISVTAFAATACVTDAVNGRYWLSVMWAVSAVVTALSRWIAGFLIRALDAIKAR